MAYDFETATDRSPPLVTTFATDPRDLEVLVTLLQLAAIELTPSAGTLFTKKQLLDQAMALGGDELGVAPSDLTIVLQYSKFLGRGPKGMFFLR